MISAPLCPKCGLVMGESLVEGRYRCSSCDVYAQRPSIVPPAESAFRFWVEEDNGIIIEIETDFDEKG